MAAGSEVYVLGGYQTDFARNWTKENKHFSALMRESVEGALQAIDAGSDDVALMASLSQARVGRFLFEMSNQLIQIHGGIGMTDEFDAGFYLKRARVLEALYGNRSFHRNRYATLRGF